MNVELDVEKRLQAVVAKDRVRIKEFFIDFDKLRKGQVGVAPVSIHTPFHKYTFVEVTIILTV
jgi:hypothetical protein|tara:strand:- start:75 stop:263 length:189 start_codon:yes stop_codon:yes gene_type:complete